MSVTITARPPIVPGASIQVQNTIALDNSYPNPAGYVFTPASFGFNIIRKIINIEAINIPAAATWLYWIVPTFATDNLSMTSFALHLAVTSTGVEVANAVNVSTASFLMTVEGN